MSEAMEKYWKAKAGRLQSKMDRLTQAFIDSVSDEDFAERAYKIFMEEDDL
ncbi:hypothetical protein [Streptomyces sp. WG5]|uniref:hypothetical protein n=1 Tax=Streptomyces sp. WG5 TaxID=3417648 RepID=UPI003CF2448B